MKIIERTDDYYLLEHEGDLYLDFHWHDRDFDFSMFVKVMNGERRLYEMFDEVSYRHIIRDIAIDKISGRAKSDRNITGELCEMAKQEIAGYER